jgi:hypothetical protein
LVVAVEAPSLCCHCYPNLLPAVAEADAEAYSKGGKRGKSKAEAEADAYASSKGGKWGKREAGE